MLGQKRTWRRTASKKTHEPARTALNVAANLCSDSLQPWIAMTDSDRPHHLLQHRTNTQVRRVTLPSLCRSCRALDLDSAWNCSQDNPNSTRQIFSIMIAYVKIAYDIMTTFCRMHYAWKLAVGCLLSHSCLALFFSKSKRWKLHGRQQLFYKLTTSYKHGFYMFLLCMYVYIYMCVCFLF